MRKNTNADDGEMLRGRVVKAYNFANGEIVRRKWDRSGKFKRNEAVEMQAWRWFVVVSNSGIIIEKFVENNAQEKI